MIVFCQKIDVIIKRLEYWSQSHAKSVGDLVNDFKNEWESIDWLIFH